MEHRTCMLKRTRARNGVDKVQVCLPRNKVIMFNNTMPQDPGNTNNNDVQSAQKVSLDSWALVLVTGSA